MIQSGTNLVVVDNSGARTVQCIKVLHKPKKQMGYTGSILVVTVKQLVRKQKSKVKKGHVYKAVVCETKRTNSRRVRRPPSPKTKFKNATSIFLFYDFLIKHVFEPKICSTMFFGSILSNARGRRSQEMLIRAQRRSDLKIEYEDLTSKS